MFKKVCLVIFCCLFVGCATTAKYQSILDTWIGIDEGVLISAWGPPQNYYPLSDEGKVIEFVRSNNVQMGGHTYTEPQSTYHSGSVNTYGSYDSYRSSYYGTSTQYVTKTTPTYNLQFWCKTRFTVDKNGKIISWSWEGNNCKAY